MNLTQSPLKVDSRRRLRRLFIITFVDVSPQNPPLQNGQERTISVPAFVKDFKAAEKKALAYAANFGNTLEGEQFQEAELIIKSIVTGGTLLT